MQENESIDFLCIILVVDHVRDYSIRMMRVRGLRAKQCICLYEADVSPAPISGTMRDYTAVVFYVSWVTLALEIPSMTIIGPISVFPAAPASRLMSVVCGESSMEYLQRMGHVD